MFGSKEKKVTGIPTAETQAPQGKHLSKVIVMFISALLIIFLSVFLHGLHQRSLKSQSEMTDNVDLAGQIGMDSQAPKGLNKTKIPPYSWADLKNDSKKKKDSIKEVKVTENPFKKPKAQTPVKNGFEQLKERPSKSELSEFQKRRLELHYQALHAPLEVNISKNDGLKITPEQSRYPNIIQNNGITSDELNSAIGGLQSSLQAASNDPNGQIKKIDFTKELEGSRGYLKATRKKALFANEIKAGTFISAILLTEINSDLPGQILGQVATDVRDSATGNNVLVPSGAKLVGKYDSQIVYGQERVLIQWDRINFPDGSTVDLGNMPGMDVTGKSGLKDQVNTHFWSSLGSALMISLFTAGVTYSQDSVTEDSSDDAKDASSALSEALGQQLGQFGIEIFRKDLNRQPTLEIRTGKRFNIFITKDIGLPIYKK
jgi:type IV secretory pathway VirB10-like protein